MSTQIPSSSTPIDPFESTSLVESLPLSTTVNDSTTSATTTLTFKDPSLKRLFVLTTTTIDAGEPSPIMSTQTWAFSSQFKTVARVLQVIMKVVLSRYDDYRDTFDHDDNIHEDLAMLVDYIPQTSGINGYKEIIDKEKLSLLMECWDKISKYFLANNNIHTGKYHAFLLSRYIIDENERKTFTKEINIHLSTEQQRYAFFD